MSTDAWAFVGLVATNIFALVGVAIQNRRQSSSVSDLHAKVEPVSNGFAKSVRESLARIELQQAVDSREYDEFSQKLAGMELRLDDHMRGHP